MTNKQSQTGGHHSLIDEIKFTKGARGYPGTLNGYREEGVKKFVIRSIHTKCHPFFPNKSTLLPRRFKVLKQNASYQISKHHPNLYPKSCPSSLPRQTEIRQVYDYNVIQHS